MLWEEQSEEKLEIKLSVRNKEIREGREVMRGLEWGKFWDKTKCLEVEGNKRGKFESGRK